MSHSQPNEVFSSSIVPNSDACKEEPSSDSSQTIILEDCKTITMSSSYEDSNVSTNKDSLIDDESPNGPSERVVMSDLKCAICKQLLCRPVVLNCGDVYCEACIIESSDNECKCPICQSPHPNGFPNVCLVLEHFLEGQFPLEYAARKESSRKLADHNLRASIGSMQDQGEASQGSVPANIYASWWWGQGPKVHIGVGCDYCGMCPIIGERYKCKDCTEEIGFDLCGGCYNSSSKLPGRFNQQHTEDHQFEIMEPHYFRLVIPGIRARHGCLKLTLLLTPESYCPEESCLNDMQEYGDASPISNSTNDGQEDVGDSAETTIPIDDSSEHEGTDVSCLDRKAIIGDKRNYQHPPSSFLFIIFIFIEDAGKHCKRS